MLRIEYMRDSLKYVTLFLFTMFSISCGNVSKDKELVVEDGWVLHESDIYAITFPKEWTVDKSGKFGVDMIVFSPTQDSTDTFRENINLYIEDLKDAAVSQEAYFDISKKQLTSFISNATILESTFVPEIGAHRNIFTGEQGVLKLKTQQYYWVENEKAYVVTLTCEALSYDNFKDIGEKIIATFTIK